MSNPQRDAMPAKDQRNSVPLSLPSLGCGGDIRAVTHPMLTTLLPSAGVRTIQFSFFNHLAKPLREFPTKIANVLESVV